MPSCGLTQVYGASAGAARPRPPFWCTRQTNPIGLNWIEQRPVDHHRRSLAQYGGGSICSDLKGGHVLSALIEMSPGMWPLTRSIQGA